MFTPQFKITLLVLSLAAATFFSLSLNSVNHKASQALDLSNRAYTTSDQAAKSLNSVLLSLTPSPTATPSPTITTFIRRSFVSPVPTK